MTSGPFKLYPEERHWWSFQDYGAVLDTMRALRPARVLEFGPGSSTLALLEGGAQAIDTCEDDPDWAAVYEERLQGQYPTIVMVRRYDWCEPVSIPAIDGQTYDLALIDGPLGTNRRPYVVRYCMDRCAAVLAPTEDANPAFRRALHAIANERGWEITIRDTGPLSGGFALLTPPTFGYREVFAVGPQAEAHVKELPPFVSPEEARTLEDAPENAGIDPSTLETPEDPAPLSNTMVPPATVTRRRSRGRHRKGPKP